MILRLIRSIIFGAGLAFCSAMFYIAVLWLHYHSPSVPAHHGIGAVAGGISPAILLAPLAFVAGFIWEWRHSSSS